MSRTSKKYFDEEFKKEIWEPLIKDLKNASSEKKLVGILGKILAPSEIITVEKRLAVQYLLSKGKSYRKISEIADVHYNTVSFVKNSLIRKKYKKREYTKIKKEESFMKSLLGEKDNMRMMRPYRFSRKIK